MTTLELGIVIPDTVDELLEIWRSSTSARIVILGVSRGTALLDPLGEDRLHEFPIPVPLPMSAGERAEFTGTWSPVGIYCRATRSEIETGDPSNPWEGAQLHVGGDLHLAPYDHVTWHVHLLALADY